MGRYLGLAAIGIALSACGAKHEEASRSPQEIERSAYEAQRAADRGRERAMNEAAMRQYPEAGITADMSGGERDSRIKAYADRQMAESMKKINDVVDSASRPR